MISADGHVFDVTGVSSSHVAVLVVDVDQHGVNMVHNLHIVFPPVKIVAITNKPGNVLRARRYGATTVVFGSDPATTNSIVSGFVNALLVKSQK